MDYRVKPVKPVNDHDEPPLASASGARIYPYQVSYLRVRRGLALDDRR